MFKILGFLSLLLSCQLVSQPEFSRSYPNTLNRKRVWTAGLSQVGTYASLNAFLSFIWYKDAKRVPFNFYNDSKGYLQMDKAGHFYGAYRESFVAYYALRWAGVSKKKALLYGAPVGLLLQTPIEIFDGLYEGWGFSWPDMVANTLGAVVFGLQEAAFDEQRILVKFSYAPSPYPKYHSRFGDNHLVHFFNDYNAHTYWLSLNVKDFFPRTKLPTWFNLAFGYSANGLFGEMENPKFYRGEPFPHFERYRQYLFSLDIDLSKIKTKRKFLRKIFRAVNMLKIPFPAVEWNRIGGWGWHWLYF